jgi:hypothetical protein
LISEKKSKAIETCQDDLGWADDGLNSVPCFWQLLALVAHGLQSPHLKSTEVWVLEYDDEALLVVLGDSA